MTLRFNTLALAAALFSTASMGQENVDAEEAAAAAGEAAAEAVLGEIEREASEGTRLERQLRHCRTAVKYEDWVAYIDLALLNDPALGSREEHLRTCMAYLAGRRDQLVAERQQM